MIALTWANHTGKEGSLMHAKCLILALSFCFFYPLSVRASFDSGSDGSDGAFNPASSVEVDLGLAIPGDAITMPGAGNGVYDAARWVVCFKYTTITVPAGVTITFKNHTSGAPVVWLATGDIHISGSVRLDGAGGTFSSQPPSFAQPGPGGFEGGVRGTGASNTAGTGFGPGGSTRGITSSCGGAGHANVGSIGSGGEPGGLTYSSPQIASLIGGSGGGGNSTFVWGGGGAGGGAILIATSTNITLDTGALVSAIGGSGSGRGGGGSGGSIRLIAPEVLGGGQLRAGGVTSGGGTGSAGRIRVDADTISLTDNGSPPWTTEFSTFPVFLSSGPTLRVTSVAGITTTTDPSAGILTPDVAIADEGPVTVFIDATNIPAGTLVQVRVVPSIGAPTTATSTPLADSGGGILTASATLAFPPGRSEIQLRANW